MKKKDVIFRHFFHGKIQEIQENSGNPGKFRKIQENSGKFRKIQKKLSEKFIKNKK
jgi:hypothetical protein